MPDSTLKRDGGLLGTPAYSAPECIASGAFSPLSDQFSMAATLYEAVSQRRAFPGEDAVTVAGRIATEEPVPIAEIAGAARQAGARAVALSLVYPEDDQRLESDLIQLRDLLGDKVAILAGGRAAPTYAAWLKRINAMVTSDLRDFSRALDGLRRGH